MTHKSLVIVVAGLRVLPSGLAAILSLAILISIITFTWTGVSAPWLEQNRERSLTGDLATDFATDGSFLAIMLRNLGAIAFLYSGAATLGVTTVIALSLVSLYLGATLALTTFAAGLDTVAQNVMIYAPFEFVGIIIAGAAGLYPAMSVLVDALSRRDQALIRSYTTAVPGSLTLFLISAVLIVIGAGLEATVIASR